MKWFCVFLASLTFSFTAAARGEVLLIHADGETVLLNRLIGAFRQRYPETEVRLETMSAALVAHSVVSAPASGRGPDLAISAAVDRQVKLVNDGHAQGYVSPSTERLPDWAQWRSEIFGFTWEEVVFVYDPSLVSAEEMPRSRLQLTRLLEEQPERFRGRVHTNHIGLDGLGYVFATFESLASPLYWRLLRSMGAVEARLATDPQSLLDAMKREEGAIAWSLARSDSVIAEADRLGLVLVRPQDYRLALLRTMVIAQTARNPGAARAFIDFTLSDEGQALVGETALLGPGAPWHEAEGDLPASPVALGPATLVFLDDRKRMRFMDTWLELLVIR